VATAGVNNRKRGDCGSGNSIMKLIEQQEVLLRLPDDLNLDIKLDPSCHGAKFCFMNLLSMQARPNSHVA